MTEKLKETKLLKTYQMDRHALLRPIMLMNELQAVADTHAETLGAGRTFLTQNNLAWVVTHYLVDIIEMPTENEVIEISTWPSGQNGLKATREFQIRGNDGRTLVNATSQWVIIDLETRRVLRLDGTLPHWDMITERAYDRTFDKFPDFTPDVTKIVLPRFDDVDVNQHINNSVYAVWATESLGFDFRNEHKLRGIDINFKKEIAAGTAEVFVESTCENTADGEIISRHMIKTPDAEHAIVVCRWEKI